MGGGVLLGEFHEELNDQKGPHTAFCVWFPSVECDLGSALNIATDVSQMWLLEYWYLCVTEVVVRVLVFTCCSGGC